MKVSVEQVGPCRKALRVEIPAERVAGEYALVLGEFSKHARISGFRKGKAPVAIVERHYGKDILEETRERLLPRAYHEALAQEHLTPVAVVDVSDVQVDKRLPLSFKATVDVVPEFALPDYKGIPVKSRPVEVKDAEIEQVLNGIRDRQARFEAVEGRAARKEDVVEIDYVGTCDGQPMGAVAPDRPELAQGKDFWVLLSDNVGEFLPGLKPQLEGVEIGQTREVSIAFPADYRVASAAGKTASYTVTVRGIRERKSPEMNDEFATSVGATSVEDLRQKVKENLHAAAVQGETGRQKDELLKWLMERVEMKDLPQSLVEEEARHIIQDVVQENVRRGVDKDEIEKNREDIFNRAAQSASDRVRMNYVLSRIAEEEKVVVSDEDLDRRVADMAARYGMPPQAMKAELEKRGSLAGLRRSLRLDKTVDLMLAAAIVTPE